MLSGGAGLRALTFCFREIFALENALDGVRLHGQTDPQILHDVLERAGLDPDGHPERLTTLQNLYLERLAHEIKDSDKALMMPGVKELLEELARCDFIHMGLVTGNVERGARIKLSRFDLNRYFEVGGYGSDSKMRRDLVPVAIDRAQQRFGVRFATADVVVIGDTERDVDCGRFAGARTVAVATGGTSYDDLATTNPDHLLKDLSDTTHVLSLLVGSEPRASRGSR